MIDPASRQAAIERAVRQAVAMIETGRVTQAATLLRSTVQCADRPPPPDATGEWPEHPEGDA